MLVDHPRLFLVNCHLGVHRNATGIDHHLHAKELMDQFRDALSARIQKLANVMMKQGRYLARTRVNTFWVTDLIPNEVSRFQLVIVVNYDTFFKLEALFSNELGFAVLIQADWHSVTARGSQMGIGDISFLPEC